METRPPCNAAAAAIANRPMAANRPAGSHAKIWAESRSLLRLPKRTGERCLARYYLSRWADESYLSLLDASRRACRLSVEACKTMAGQLVNQRATYLVVQRTSLSLPALLSRTFWASKLGTYLHVVTVGH